MIRIREAQRAISGVLSGNNSDRRRLFLISLKQEGYYLLLILPAILLLIFFFVLPLTRMVGDSFGGGDFTLEHYDKALTSGIFRRVFRTTFELSAFTTLGGLLLGYPVAYFLATSSGWRRTIVLITVIVPFISNLIAQIWAWRVILGRRGLVNEGLEGIGIIDEPLSLLFNRFSVSVATLHIFLPFMILPIYAAMLGIPRGLSKLAEGLGASPLKSFWRVFLPLSMPGVWAGTVLVFVLSAGFFLAPDMLGNPGHRGIASFIRGSGGFSSALAVLLLTAIVILYLIFARFIGFRPLYRAGEILMSSDQETDRRTSLHRLPLVIVVAVVGLFLLLPTAIIIPVSFSESSYVLFPPKGFTMEWYSNYFTSGPGPVDWIKSTITSLEIAALVVIFIVPLGALVSYGVVRGQFPGKRTITSLLISPLIIPTVISAWALFFFYSNHLRFLFGTLPGFVIPHTILALPYVVIILTATLRNADEVQEHSAMSLGASRITIFRRIILPQIYPGIAIAAFLAFLVSFNEVVLALFLRTVHTQTLPMNLWDGRAGEFGPMIAAVSNLLLLVTLVVFVGGVYLRKLLSRHT